VRSVALLSAATAAVLALGGCSALGLPPMPGRAKPSTTAGGVPRQMPENTVYQGGTGPGASPTPVPNGSPVRTPLALLPSLPTGTPYPTTGVTPLNEACSRHYQQGVRNGLVATPRSRAATMTWWNLGDPALQYYELAAVSQQYVLGLQPPWKWTTVPAGQGCTLVTVTVSNLTSGDPYVFVLHAVIKNYENVPPIIPEIARSNPIVIL